MEIPATTTTTQVTRSLNRGPSAADDLYDVRFGDVLTVPAPGVLGNDRDADGDRLTPTLLSTTRNGTLAFNPSNGSFVYTHDEGDLLTDSFSYRVEDGNGAADQATVRITVTPPDLAFVDRVQAVDDDVTSFISEPLLIDALANDTSSSGDLRFGRVSEPSVGTLEVEDGKLRFTPPAGWVGTTTASYVAESDNGESDTATITIRVGSLLLERDEVTLVEHRPILVSVLANDISADGNVLDITSFTQPDRGLAELTDTGEMLFTPEPGFVGDTSFTYTATTSSGEFATATVLVTVLPVAAERAKERADTVGADLLGSDVGEAVFASPTPVPRASFAEGGIALFVDAMFFQLGALRLPVVGFALATLWTVTMLGLVVLFGRNRTMWAVTGLDRRSTLPATSEPGGSDVVFRFSPDADSIWSERRGKTVNDVRWRRVDTPNGPGWVTADNLRRLRPHAKLDLDQ